MKQMMSWLQNSGLIKVASIFLATLVLLITPVFIPIATLQAQADTAVRQDDSPSVTRDTVKRIQQKAEDLGDSDKRPIGDTGLKNIRKLGENIPETVDLNVRQKGAIYDSDQPNKVKAMDRGQTKAERAAARRDR